MATPNKCIAVGTDIMCRHSDCIAIQAGGWGMVLCSY